jgi:hypothetical protein
LDSSLFEFLFALKNACSWVNGSEHFKVKKIEGFENTHFKLIGNYLLAFEMDQFSCIYPSGITTNDITVFKYDPNKLPKSKTAALFKVSAKSAKYAPEPKFLINTADPHLIYYASTLSAPSQRSVNGPYLVEIFDLTSESDTPIKKQKIIGDAYAFSGKYLAWSKTGNPDKKIYLINWQEFSNPDQYEDKVLNTEKNVKELSHQEIVKGVIFHKDLVACSETSGHVTIWDIKDELKLVKRIDLKKITNETCFVSHFDGTLLWVMFNPNGTKLARNSCAVLDWQTEKEIKITISTKELYFGVHPLYSKNGTFSGKMALTQPSSTDILYISTPYLAKKFDVAVLTAEKDIIRGKHETTIYGNLAEDCQKLLGLATASSLTSQVILSNSVRRYVLLFEENVIKNDDDEEEKPKKSQLTELLHLTVLSRHEHAPYGGIDFDGYSDKKNPSMRRRVEVKTTHLYINGPCILMKEELTEDFGWVPVNLEQDLTVLLADLTSQMRTLYNAYHGFI